MIILNILVVINFPVISIPLQLLKSNLRFFIQLQFFLKLPLSISQRNKPLIAFSHLDINYL